MRKYLFIVLIFLFIPIFVMARPADPYRFPKVEPLRPPIENVAPNYPNNINASDLQAGTTEKNNSELDIQENEKTNLENQSAEKIIKNSSSTKTSKAFIVVVLILVFGAIFGTLLYIYRKKFRKHSDIN